MRHLLLLILLVLLASCASQENTPDPARIRADERAREDFAKQLPKPADR